MSSAARRKMPSPCTASTGAVTPVFIAVKPRSTSERALSASSSGVAPLDRGDLHDTCADLSVILSSESLSFRRRVILTEANISDKLRDNPREQDRPERSEEDVFRRRQGRGRGEPGDRKRRVHGARRA